MNVPYVIEHSGSPQSYHIWIFLHKALPVEKVYRFAHHIVTCTDTGVKFVDCEIYPKQRSSDGVKYGNLVKLPLGVNWKTHARSSLLNSDMCITDKTIVQTIDISEYDIPNIRGENRNGNGIHVTNGTTGSRNSSLIYTGVRPCIKDMLENGTQFEHADGHMMRIAVAVELLRCTDMSLDDVAMAFSTQCDFNYEKTVEQIESVRHYERTHCFTLQERCWSFVGGYCIKCPLYE